MAYLLPIGGDHFEFRPLDFYWPLLAVPAAEGIALLGSGISTGLRRFPRVPRWAAGGGTYTIALFLPVLFYANAIQGVLLIRGGYASKILRMHAELNEENAGWLLAAPGMPALVAISNECAGSPPGLNGVGLRFARAPRVRQLAYTELETIRKMERGFFPDDA